MKTDDLIHALAQDAASVETPPRRALNIALVIAAVLAAGAFFVLLHPRDDILQAAHQARFLAKFVLTAALGVVAATLVVRLARPGASAPLRLLAVPLALAVAAVVLELASTPAPEWRARMIGVNWLVCLSYVPLIAAAPLAVLVATLRQAAPTRPTLAGAVAGLAAGALGAFFYAAHCPDDSPLFVAVWYTLAIAIVTGAGALAGARWLRW
ncbi:MAG: hypothetical protein JWN07_205 [Hyphomicrobiales bacterium]|nr:hypothetical protein [Hyphomicrobiales bacterium]